VVGKLVYPHLLNLEGDLVNRLNNKLIFDLMGDGSVKPTILTLPDMFTKVVMLNVFEYGKEMGLDIPSELTVDFGDVSAENRYRMLMAENLVHLDKIGSTLLVGDGTVKKVQMFFRDNVYLDTNYGALYKLMISTSLLGMVMEYYSAELYAQKLGKRIINDSGWHEFVPYDHPGEVDTIMWK